MALRINTNVAAMTAHNNMIKNDNGLTSSLEKLSSGLRINRAADDASGMAIADALKSQSLGLGQAIRNANDGISMVQTADGALDESIKIVNTIKTKAIQAAQDGQTTESRKAIQSDVDKLLEELDIIAQTTAFNNQKLLSGNFVDKKFQVGAYSGETVNISISSAESGKVGHVTSGNLELTNESGGTVQLSIFSNLQNKEFTLQAVDVQFNNSAENGMAAVANAINKLSDVLGISADDVVESTSAAAVAAGSTGSDFAINGVAIGQVTVQDNDSDGALVKAINNKTADHGILASVGADGFLKLSSTDGRAIEVTGSTGDVLAGSTMSTFGHVQLRQTGSNELLITDLASGSAVNFDDNVGLEGADITTTIASTLSANSVIGSESILKAGSSLGADFAAADIKADIVTTQDSNLLAGSVLVDGTIIEKGTVLGGTFAVDQDETATASSTLEAGSVLQSGSVLAKGTLVTTDIRSGGVTITAGSVLNADTTISADVTLGADMIALKNTVIASGSTFEAGSSFGVDFTTSGSATLIEDMTLKAGSTIEDTAGVDLKAGSTIGGDMTNIGSTTLTRAATIESGSTLYASGTSLAKGATLGGAMTISSAETTAGDVTLAAGSVLASASLLKQGTVLTNDIVISGGATLSAGTVLEQDYYTDDTVANALTFDMTIKTDSVLNSNSVMAANAGGASGTTVTDTSTARLADVSVLTQADAQVAIAVADSALKDLDKVRSDLGSVQNQLTSTIANLSATKVNIAAAESAIRDVDFAEEAANFSKMQILNQASSFAMAQANASSQNVLSLLQG